MQISRNFHAYTTFSQEKKSRDFFLEIFSGSLWISSFFLHLYLHRNLKISSLKGILRFSVLSRYGPETSAKSLSGILQYNPAAQWYVACVAGMAVDWLFHPFHVFSSIG
jgi:hypothetical protein